MDVRARQVGFLVAILAILATLAPPTVAAATARLAGGQQEAPEQKIDINEADAVELQRVPGIGPAMAQRILDWREQHGRFARLEDLLDIRGIGEKTLEKLRPWLEVRPVDEGSGGGR